MRMPVGWGYLAGPTITRLLDLHAADIARCESIDPQRFPGHDFLDSGKIELHDFKSPSSSPPCPRLRTALPVARLIRPVRSTARSEPLRHAGQLINIFTGSRTGQGLFTTGQNFADYKASRCHSQKTKCTGKQPCLSCVRSGRAAECIFPHRARKIVVLERYLICPPSNIWSQGRSFRMLTKFMP